MPNIVFPGKVKLIVSLTVGTVVCAKTYFYLKSIDYRGVVSMLCERMSDEPINVADLARDAFDSVDVPEVPLAAGHTHPDAAASRNSGVRVAHDVAAFIGSSVHILQMSRADQRRGHRGTRQWYWSKDTHVKNRDDPRRPDDVVYICDVDYYMDMPYLLADEAKPTILYTAVPSAAVTFEEDSVTLFNESGELVTRVAGGGSYKHSLWNYGYDSVVARKTMFGFTYRLVTYAVERKQVSPHRQIVLLAPIKVFNGLAAWLASWIVEGHYVERFNPIVHTNAGDFVRFIVHRKTGTLVTTARANTMLCCTIPAEIDAAVAGAARLGTTNLMLPTVASWLGKDKRAESVVLTEYHRASQGDKMPTVFPVDQAVRSYQYEPDNYDPNQKAKLEAFMSPLVHGAFAPVANAAGERRCVKGRINDLKKPEPKPSQFRDQCLREFVDLVVKDVVLEPVDYNVVAEKQTRPAQKQSLLKAVVSGPHVKRVLKCFIKAEAYGDVKDPRNISAYNDSDKLDMSMFCLSLSAHMKQFKWYAPGMTPLEVAERVAEICRGAHSFVNVSDYHRMDGTISYMLRNVERGVMMKTFVNHRAKLNDLLKRNANNTGFLPNGTTFQQDSSHGSGCAGTSLFQTMRAAFTAYLAYRHTKRDNGLFYSPEQAFDALGIHSGDDGLDADLPPLSHEWAAKKTGLILEASTVDRGFPGVNFLARYYSEEVWEGRADSMCDVKRQLAKFHTTVRLPDNILAEHKLVEKSMAYVATDRNTPVVGPLCKRVLMLSDYRPRTDNGIAHWWSKFDDSVQFPNSNADGWMDVEFYRQFPEFDHKIFDDWLVKTRTASEILEAPLCAEPPVPTIKVDVVVDGDVALAEVQPVVSTEPPSQGTNQEPVCEEASAPAPSPRECREKKTRAIKRNHIKSSPKTPEKQTKRKYIKKNQA